ncbi:unannotated protein [freshwater metagenome]|uniref:Unannotated protein n=1 Tax=freshwater metagenome TaxID=449393 RepID=A0A6J7I1P6_9ZZZZ|nr:hypothetical protein [Actinomycetota bacterium]
MATSYWYGQFFKNQLDGTAVVDFDTDTLKVALTITFDEREAIVLLRALQSHDRPLFDRVVEALRRERLTILHPADPPRP